MRELYQVWPAAIDDIQIQNILDTSLEQPELDAITFASKDVLSHLRVSSIRWVSSPLIQELLWTYVRRANYYAFNIDVENRCEIQYTEYHSSQSGHYSWHQDVHWNGQSDLDRKLSVTVQLSDADSYEGGDFEFDELNTNANFRAKGTVLVFPSYLRHRVLPVSYGMRQSLVSWFKGPRWR